MKRAVLSCEGKPDPLLAQVQGTLEDASSQGLSSGGGVADPPRMSGGEGLVEVTLFAPVGLSFDLKVDHCASHVSAFCALLSLLTGACPALVSCLPPGLPGPHSP